MPSPFVLVARNSALGLTTVTGRASEHNVEVALQLDDRDRSLVEMHWVKVETLMLPMFARFEGGQLEDTPEGRSVLGSPHELRVSLAIVALAGPRSGNTVAHVVEVPRSDQWAARLVTSLNRRKVTWDTESAALALRLVASSEFDDERVQLVLKASDQVAASRPGEPGVMDGLDRVHAMVCAESNERYRVLEMRARVLASIARHSPPEIFDLSPILETDVWGPAARAAIADAGAYAEVGAILSTLVSAPSTTEPSARWLKSVDELSPTGPAADLLRSLVRLLVDLPVPEAGPLVIVGNDQIARAAIWAVGHLATSEDDVGLLCEVGRRCSKTSGRPYETEALCGKGAGAAVTMLARLRREGGEVSAVAEAGLQFLWRTVDRGDVLRRLGSALDHDSDTISHRVKEAKRTKAVQKVQRINPDPPARRAHLGEIIGEDVTPRLTKSGFTDRRGKTFRRHHPSHTDIVMISIADAQVRLAFGLGFHFPAARPASTIDDCDVAVDMAFNASDPADDNYQHWTAMFLDGIERRADRGVVDPLETLAKLIEVFETSGLPVLARWANPGLLANDLEDLAVPFHHGRLLLGLHQPSGAARLATIGRLRAIER